MAKRFPSGILCFSSFQDSLGLSEKADLKACYFQIGFSPSRCLLYYARSLSLSLAEACLSQIRDLYSGEFLQTLSFSL